MPFMQFIAVDWSGNAGSARKFTAVAVVKGGELTSVETGRTGVPLANHLRDLAKADPETVIGLDFAFSLPAWFLQERGYATAQDLWRAARAEGEQWLLGSGPFWGRPGVKKPLLREHFRQTDRAVPGVGGIAPKSVFQVGGAGAVGTGSIRGMPFLLDLVERGFHVWPFETGWPLVVEIYPRILTGAVVKSGAAARREYLREARWALDPALVEAAAASEDTFDAAISALVMAQHAEELRTLNPNNQPQTRLEGQIWIPRSTPPPPIEDIQPLLSDRFDDALTFATRAHRHQLRKGSKPPIYRAPAGSRLNGARGGWR